MTAERGFAGGTVTDKGVIATSSAVTSIPSAPARTIVNDAALMDGALSSRSKPTTIERSIALSVELGSGDNDVTRIGAFDAETGSAPLLIHVRMMSMSLCGRAGSPAGMRS